MTCAAYHIPVLLNETIDGLNIRPDGIYVDLTFGGGGHSQAILNQLGEKGRLYSFDQDLDAMKGSFEDNRFQFVRSNFRFISNWMMYYGIEQVDGILADLGVSSHHLDTEERGFSFRYDAPLDMRMNQKASLTAEKVINEYPEESLANILFLYGELKNSRKLAAAITKQRNTARIQTTGQLTDLLDPLLNSAREKKDLARVFQALRIEVNGEMNALRQMLLSVSKLLCPNGRLAILTYHSLEDRMVKNIIRTGNIEGKNDTDIFGHNHAPLRADHRGVITASKEELAANPRSRSAKLRIAEKVNS